MILQSIIPWKKEERSLARGRGDGEYLERTNTAMQIRNDDSIRDDVLFELKWDPKIGSSSDIAVAVKDGVVTLSGFVRSYWDKDAAGTAAKRVYGVRGVANDIEVKPNTVRTDPEIAREAIQELETFLLHSKTMLRREILTSSQRMQRSTIDYLVASKYCSLCFSNRQVVGGRMPGTLCTP